MWCLIVSPWQPLYVCFCLFLLCMFLPVSVCSLTRLSMRCPRCRRGFGAPGYSCRWRCAPASRSPCASTSRVSATLGLPLPRASFLNDLRMDFTSARKNWLVKGLRVLSQFLKKVASGFVSTGRSKSMKAPGLFASFHLQVQKLWRVACECLQIQCWRNWPWTFLWSRRATSPTCSCEFPFDANDAHIAYMIFYSCISGSASISARILTLSRLWIWRRVPRFGSVHTGPCLPLFALHRFTIWARETQRIRKEDHWRLSKIYRYLPLNQEKEMPSKILSDMNFELSRWINTEEIGVWFA